MAVLFDLDAEREANQARDSIAAEVFDTFADRLLEMPGARAIREIERFRGRLDALECKILGGYIGDNGDTRAAEGLAGSTGASKKTRKRKARRASAAKKNPKLADKLASGEMSGEHADIVADAAEKTDGAAAVDDDFIDKVAGADVDQAAQFGRDYVTAKTDAAKAQARHDRQRAHRTVKRFVTKDHLDALLVKGDTESIDAIYNDLTAGAKDLYIADGGRDVPAGQHRRTHNQRLYDTLTSRFTPKTGSDNTDTTAGGGGVEAAAAAKQRRGPIRSKRYTPAKVRPIIVIGVTLEKYLGMDPDKAAELIGGGPIADSVLAQYLTADPVIIGALYGQDGQPLWLGREARYATNAQYHALIMRDKGCVCCGKHHMHCEAHHLFPWNAPIQGETDITKLALLCGDCHRRLHADNHTLYRHHSGTWRTRPATAHETPPQPASRPGNGKTPQRK